MNPQEAMDAPPDPVDRREAYPAGAGGPCPHRPGTGPPGAMRWRSSTPTCTWAGADHLENRELPVHRGTEPRCDGQWRPGKTAPRREHIPSLIQTQTPKRPQKEGIFHENCRTVWKGQDCLFPCEVFPPRKHSPVDSIYRTLDGPEGHPARLHQRHLRCGRLQRGEPVHPGDRLHHPEPVPHHRHGPSSTCVACTRGRPPSCLPD